jgi:hypothetical protein
MLLLFKEESKEELWLVMRVFPLAESRQVPNKLFE